MFIGIHKYINEKIIYFIHFASVRVQNHIRSPNWSDYLTDDEIAVQNVIKELYPESKTGLCIFHINKNIIKIIGSYHLSNFIKGCKTDVELWAYAKFRLIMCLPFLPENKMRDQFCVLRDSILEVLSKHLNAMEIEGVTNVLEHIDKSIYSKAGRIASVCKFDKTIRTTNNAEGSHSGFNKSSLIARSSGLNSMIQGKIFSFQ